MKFWMAFVLRVYLWYTTHRKGEAVVAMCREKKLLPMLNRKANQNIIGGISMIRNMTVDDYDSVFDLCANTASMRLRSVDDSREGVDAFLKRNPGSSFVALDGLTVVGSILCGHDGRDTFFTLSSVMNTTGRGSVPLWSTPPLRRCKGKALPESVST